MKICFFVGSISNSGGTERVSTFVANALVDKGHTVSFLSLYGENKSFFSLHEKIKCVSIFPKKEKFINIFPLVMLKLRQFISKDKCNVLINVESLLSIYSIPAVVGLGVRNVCWEHFNYNIDLGLKSRKIARHLAAFFCDDVITLTSRDRELWLKNTFHRANIRTINNPSPFETKVVCDVGSKPDKFVLSIGRFTEQKGFDLLLLAWEKVLMEKSDWILRIVGDGDMRPELEKLISERKLDRNVELVPTTQHIESYYKSSRLYVMSSRFEGLPMVLLEALSFGLPIVSTNCDTGPSEIIIPGCGWLCNSNDIESLAKTIVLALSTLDSDYNFGTMSCHSLENSNRFLGDNIVDEWLELLNAKA